MIVSAIVTPIIRPARREEDFELEVEDRARAVGETEFVPDALGGEGAPLISEFNSVCITKIVRKDSLGQTGTGAYRWSRAIRHSRSRRPRPFRR